MRKIRNELGGKIPLSKYKDISGKNNDMYILTLKQALRVEKGLKFIVQSK